MISIVLSLLLSSAPAGAQAPAEKPAEKTAAKPARDRKLLLSTIISSLKDEDENIRAKAAEDLSKIEPPAVEAVPALIKSLGDSAPNVRYRCAEALERIGTPKARKAVLKFRRKMSRDKGW